MMERYGPKGPGVPGLKGAASWASEWGTVISDPRHPDYHKPITSADGVEYVVYEDGLYHPAPRAGITTEADARRARAQTASPDRIEQNGIVYERQADGTWLPAQGIPEQTRTGAQAPAPHVDTDRNGDMVGVDARTGAVVWRIAGVDWPKVSPEEQNRIRQGDVMLARQWESEQSRVEREYRAGEAAAGRQFTAGENAASRSQTASEGALNRTQSSSEAALNRQYQSGESALDRAMRSSEFGATYNLNLEQARVESAMARANAERQRKTDQLGAARQLADVISSTDPAAVAAFSAAGGGVLSNARASGATALSANAMLPAARTWQAVDELAQPTSDELAFRAPAPYSAPVFAPYAPPAAAARNPLDDPAYIAQVQRRGGYPGDTNVIGVGRVSYDPSSPYYRGPGGGSSAPAATPDPYAGFRVASANQTAAGVENTAPPRYAFGTQGEPAVGPFMAGDSEDPANPAAGGAQPEMIIPHDPPGPNNATADVVPMTPPGGPMGGSAVARLFSAIGEVLAGEQAAPPMMGEAQRYAFGTGRGDGMGDGPAYPYIPGRVPGGRMPETEGAPPEYGTQNVMPFSAKVPGGRQTRLNEYAKNGYSRGWDGEPPPDLSGAPMLAQEDAEFYGGWQRGYNAFQQRADNQLPRYAFGTLDDPSGLLTDADEPYIEKVRGLRTGVDTTEPVEGGYFNAGFGLLPQTVQERYYRALQARYGVAAGDFAGESRRFAMPGTRSATQTFGY